MNHPRSTRRGFLRLAGGTGALTLASCGKLKQLASLLPSGPKMDRMSPFTPPAGESIDLITHALNRLSWGVAPGEYQRVSALGATREDSLRRYVEEQLAPEKIEDRYARSVLAPMEAIREPVAELYEYKPAQLNDELTRQAVIRAVHSRRQLYEVMVGFWTDHFNIDSSKTDCRWFKVVDDRAVIRPHALGNFRDLLQASALSPAMLVYLDGRANKKRRSVEKPNENYARELLELHSLGVRGGYTQQDVMEAARCLTGWTVTGREVKNGLADVAMGLQSLAGRDSGGGIGRVLFEAGAHDDGAKTVLGTLIPAGGGREDLDRLLDIVAIHPSTAKFIATKLCRHFIADEPPHSAVKAVATAFHQSRGNLKDTLRSLFSTEEFAAARGMKIKRPFHFIVSALRSTGAHTSSGGGVQRSLQVMGHTPFHYPTPEGPAPDGASWLSTLLHRWDFAARLTSGQLPCSKIDPARLTECAGGRDGLLRHLFGRQPDSSELAAATAVSDVTALALASPAFQVFYSGAPHRGKHSRTPFTPMIHDLSSTVNTVIAADRDPAPVLVNVFLRGGADGLHLVPPVEDDAYFRARPTIAVKKSDVLRLDGMFGLHPDLAPLHPIYQSGGMAVVHQCGTAEESRSHFEAEDYLQHGGFQGGGWIGRFLHQTRSPADGPLTAVSIGSVVSDCLRGAAAVALRSLDEFTLPDKDPALRGQLAALYGKAGGALGFAGGQTLMALERIEAVRNSTTGPQNGASYGSDEFSSGLSLIARLIRARVGLRAATIELGGWDSHFTQLTLTAGLMPRLAAGLAAFHRDLGNEMCRVHVVGMSEFGRRVDENVSIGTDHGRAGVMFVMGGGVKGGNIIADWPRSGLVAAALEGPGDIPVKYAMHHVLTPVLKRIRSGVDMTKVFPDLPPGELAV